MNVENIYTLKSKVLFQSNHRFAVLHGKLVAKLERMGISALIMGYTGRIMKGSWKVRYLARYRLLVVFLRYQS